MKIKGRHQKQERLEKANELIETIASCGRRFFWSEKFGRISYFELAENGRLYYWDKYTNKRLPLSHTKSGWWARHFTEGGTLKHLIELLANYIRYNSVIYNHNVFGPWEKWLCDGDLWGYGDDMKKVRDKASKLGILGITRKENK